jgi:hypothetical protein
VYIDACDAYFAVDERAFIDAHGLDLAITASVVAFVVAVVTGFSGVKDAVAAPLLGGNVQNARAEVDALVSPTADP